MDIATIVGFAGNTALLLVVMMMSGSLLMYWDAMSLIVVLGGSMFSTMARWPLPNFISGSKAIVKTVSCKIEPPEQIIDEVCNLADTARKNSILALEKVPVANQYLAKAVKFAVDGQSPETIDEVIVAETKSMKKRHKDGRSIMTNMSEACPAFGMIGTVIGLVVIMANLSDPSKIGPGLAVALVTTLYGGLLANMVFAPLAQKLEFRSDEEIKNLILIQKGISAMLKGENPRAIREKLESYV